MVFRYVALATLVAYSAVPLAVHAVAYCALRDPVNTIYELFPRADAYRSSVKTVGRHAREAVIDQLPFSLHFNELGRHTLYVAQRDGATIGFVHARSELGEWGLTEFAWALTPDLRIQGVKVQRARDPSLRQRVKHKLAPAVVGKDLSALQKQYGDLAAEDSAAAMLVTSAMKTLVITQNVWRSEVIGLDVIGVAKQVFPEASKSHQLADLHDEEAMLRLTRLELEESPIFDRSALVGYRVERDDGAPLAMAVYSPFELDNPHRQLVWLIAPDGEIKAVHNQQSGRVDHDFQSVLGYAPESARECSTLADIAALEMATLARRHLSD